MYGKSNRETYITMCKKGLCINLVGWDGEEDGKEVQKGRDIPMADSCRGLTENKIL